MFNKLMIVAMCGLFIVCAHTAFANGSYGCDSYIGKYLNECSPHTVDTDTIQHDHSGDALGVGADVLIHETDNVDLVVEYKYDFENESHSTYAVFKTKKSLVEYIKALLNRD